METRGQSKGRQVKSRKKPAEKSPTGSDGLPSALHPSDGSPNVIRSPRQPVYNVDASNSRASRTRLQKNKENKATVPPLPGSALSPPEESPNVLRSARQSLQYNVGASSSAASRSRLRTNPDNEVEFPDLPKYLQKRHKELVVVEEFLPEIPEWTPGRSTDVRFRGLTIWTRTSDDAVLEPARANCTCAVKKTVECVSLHTGERMMVLFKELGAARFNDFGLHLARSIQFDNWTLREKRLFEQAVYDHPKEDPKNEIYTFHSVIEDCQSRLLPHRTRAELVRYYYSIFIAGLKRQRNHASQKHVMRGSRCGLLDP